MYRIAQETPSSPVDEQSCGVRPKLKLQTSPSPSSSSLISQVCITLPDRLLCRYPDTSGHMANYRIVVHSLGDNAHGVCFLMGVAWSEHDAASGSIAFRIDRVDGPVLRIDSGESLSVHIWERRVRQRFANDRQTDALPLSSLLITDDARASAWQHTPDSRPG